MAARRAPEPRWVDTKQLAEYLGLKERAIRNMRADGRIRAYNFGPKIIRYDLNEVDDLLRASNGNGAGDTPLLRNAQARKSAQARRAKARQARAKAGGRTKSEGGAA